MYDPLGDLRTGNNIKVDNLRTLLFPEINKHIDVGWRRWNILPNQPKAESGGIAFYLNRKGPPTITARGENVAPLALREVGDAISPSRDSSAATR